MLSSIGRAAIRRLGATSSCQPRNRVYQSIWIPQRVDTHKTTPSCLSRSYATASSPKLKPKSASKTKSAAKKAASKKAVKAKPKAKTKPKKKILTEEQKEKAHLKALKLAALTKPKLKPATAWTVLVSEHAANTTSKENATSLVKGLSASYKSLSPKELEKYNHTANQNKAANQTIFKEWIESHTPDQIRIANNARKALNRLAKAKPESGIRKYTALDDPRMPKRPSAPRLIFARERWSSGDLKGVGLADSAAVINKEWLALPASEQKRYQDASAAETQRYLQEYKTVFNRESKSSAVSN